MLFHLLYAYAGCRRAGFDHGMCGSKCCKEIALKVHYAKRACPTVTKASINLDKNRDLSREPGHTYEETGQRYNNSTVPR